MSQTLIPPDPVEALARYRAHADGYDASAERTMWIRSATIDRLDLRVGDRVLDVACGTGLSFPMLRKAVGESGEVIGIDLSPDMVALAHDRVRAAGWHNVRILETALELAEIPRSLDAVLFHFTHDVLRSPTALQRVFEAVAPDARVALAGMKYAPWWMAPVNVIVRAKATPYMTTLDGLESPWDLALPHLRCFDWRSVLFGTGYIGWGRAANGQHPVNQSVADPVGGETCRRTGV